MIPTDVKLERIKWKLMDGGELDGSLTGCTITGAEPIDYPKTDGAIIYLKDRTGRTFAIILENDAEAEEDQGFYISIGNLPEIRRGSRERGKENG